LLLSNISWGFCDFFPIDLLCLSSFQVTLL
jgi:hypothetical protein